jgi:hypothetical protein
MPEQNTPEMGSKQNQPGESSGAGQTNRPGQTGEDDDEMQETTGGTSSQGAESDS